LPAKLALASVMVLPLPVAWPGGPPCNIEAGPHRHTDDAVFVEVPLTGTHQGEWAGTRRPAPGQRPHRLPV